VVAVSVLEAVALAAGLDGRVVAALDAQRSEVFLGDYMVVSGGASYGKPGGASYGTPYGEPGKVSGRPGQGEMRREGILSFGDFTAFVAGSDRPKVFTPDGGLADRLREAGFDAETLRRPTAEAYARIAYGKFLAGVCADVATLDANYLRRSDAEIFTAPKDGIKQRIQQHRNS
jgi:hypothetical protein